METYMRDKVDRVMKFIHGIAHRELPSDDYTMFLQAIEEAIDDDLYNNE